MAPQEQNEPSVSPEATAPPRKHDEPDAGGLSPVIWVVGFVAATLIVVAVFAAI